MASRPCRGLSWGKGICLLPGAATILWGWGQTSREARSPPRKGVEVGGSRVLPCTPTPPSQPLRSPRGTGPPPSIPTRPASLPPYSPSLASLLINIEFGRCFGMEGGQRPGTPLQLGTLGCRLSRPRGLIPGDTLPPATSSRLLSSVSSPWSRGASAPGGVPARPRSESWQGSGKEAFLPPAGERARKLPAFMSLAGPRAGCRLPWRLPGASPAPREVTAQGGCGGWKPSCLF